MLKLFFLSVTTFAILLLILNYHHSAISSSLTNRLGSTSEANPSEAVRKFWMVSLDANNFEAEKLLTDIPEDYYKMLNHCAEVTGENGEIIENGPPGLIPLTKGISDYKRTSEYNSLVEFSSTISKEQYRYFDIIMKKQTAEHAIVEASYDKEDNQPIRHYKDNFLLVNKDNNWKIFMITSYWYLSKDNKLFAESYCNQ